MEEKKIKVQLDYSIYQTLMSDAYSFGFIKSNGEPNKNKFINALIMNYYDIYQDKINKISEIVDTNDSTLTYKKIKEILFDEEKSEVKETLTFKSTIESSMYYDIIEDNLQDGVLSHFYIDMLTSYSRLRQDKREKIIFSEIYKKITTSIDTKKVITIYLEKSKIVVRPFKVSETKEGLFNYLLVMNEKNNWISSIKLSNIKSVSISKNSYLFSDEEIKQLELNMKNGPQFVMDRERIYEIILTKKGEKRFDSIFTNRPSLIKKENNHYFFTCSDFQIETYFTRFGPDAYVLHPKHLREKMKKIYLDAYNHYNQ